MLVLAVLTLTAGTSQSQTNLGRQSGMHRITIPVHTGWQFREVGKVDWRPATVPGCVHTDLLNNKLIDDPFYRDNEQKLQWIGKTDWEYQTTFSVTPEILARNNALFLPKPYSYTELTKMVRDSLNRKRPAS